MPDEAMATLMGGTTVPVTYKDGGTEMVVVRELRINERPAYARIIDEEDKCVELFCDRPAGWADTLTAESVEDIIAKGENLNLAPFRAWLGRRLKRVKFLAVDASPSAGNQPSANTAPSSASSGS
jgi:hypothetical protein